MTIRDFLELCTMGSAAFAVYNLSTDSIEFGLTDELDEMMPPILDAEIISWDYTLHGGEMVICLNYEG